MKKYLELLKNIPLFQNINCDDLSVLLAALNVRKQQYNKDETILHTGEITERFGIVLEGLVQITKEDFQGNRALLAQPEPGELFAEAFVVAKIPLTVTVQADRLTKILWISYKELCAANGSFDFLRAQIKENLTRIFAGKNVFLTGRIEHLSKRTLREKVLSYLSEQAMRAGSPDFSIPLDRQGLADYLAADRSALSAVLCKLRDEGIITFNKNRFSLLQGKI